VLEKNYLSLGAIASEETASIYGLKVLAKAINTSETNTTRFGVLSRCKNATVSIAKREDEHFILEFSVQNKAGALAQTLNIIGAHGFNMISLRSRPMKNLNWNYYFFIEAEGNINTSNGREMLQELSVICAKLKLIGSYYVK
ncbi:MAG: ACT domain-containing protein, partial [Sphaerochaetaceae bacterium]|nr:ACT domain-containing protein [Sphaerochaetaceae bacterium]